VVASRNAANQHVNRLLGLLRPGDYERLRPNLQRIPLEYRQSLYRAHKPIGFVYFIETGVGSLVNTMANGEAAEVGTIGNEGMEVCRSCWATTGRPRAFTSRFRVPA
jgi:hypothetical protein